MLIGLDFDGTLLDSRQRHVAALRHVAATLATPIPESVFSAYFQLKCEGLSGTEALRQLGVPSAADIHRLWVEIIENEEMLAFDGLYPDTARILERQRTRGHEFVLVTARQNPTAARRQIQSLGLDKIVDQIVVVAPGHSSQTKAEATRQHRFGAIVGDTEIDFQWAAELRVDFYASSFGFRSPNYWRKKQVVSYAGLSEIFEAIALAAH